MFYYFFNKGFPYIGRSGYYYFVMTPKCFFQRNRAIICYRYNHEKNQFDYKIFLRNNTTVPYR